MTNKSKKSSQKDQALYQERSGRLVLRHNSLFRSCRRACVGPEAEGAEELMLKRATAFNGRYKDSLKAFDRLGSARQVSYGKNVETAASGSLSRTRTRLQASSNSKEGLPANSSGEGRPACLLTRTARGCLLACELTTCISQDRHRTHERCKASEALFCYVAIAPRGTLRTEHAAAIWAETQGGFASYGPTDEGLQVPSKRVEGKQEVGAACIRTWRPETSLVGLSECVPVAARLISVGSEFACWSLRQQVV